MAKFTQSDVRQLVKAVLGERSRKGRQRIAMEFTSDLLGDSCTNVKFTIQQLVKLWNKVRLPR